MRWAGHVARMGERRNTIFRQKELKGKELGRPKPRSADLR